VSGKRRFRGKKEAEPSRPIDVSKPPWIAGEDDFSRCDAASTPRRYEAEVAVRQYALKMGWSWPIQFKQLSEVVREVTSALWSPTVRDLIAKARDLTGFKIIFFAGTPQDKEESLPVIDPPVISPIAISVADPTRIKGALRARGVIATDVRAEALEALEGFARCLTSPPLFALKPALDEQVKSEAKRTGGKVDILRDELVADLGMKGDSVRPKGKATTRAETFARNLRREKSRRGSRRTP
jgi:hypothetical protein